MNLFLFFFNDTATTEIYTLSLHDALPIYLRVATIVKPGPSPCPIIRIDTNQGIYGLGEVRDGASPTYALFLKSRLLGDRKSTRLNSSHGYISYAVFCLKKKK